MEIDVTAIERTLRLYRSPLLLTLIGICGLLIIDPSGASANQFDQIIAPLKKGVFLAAAGFALGGAVWTLYRAWLEFRWTRGQLIGGCDNCGGPMRQLDGRYGVYSKCLMCGCKQKGRH